MARRLLLVLLTCLAAFTHASALTDEETFRNFRFNLINPGARSLAMGGAFISIADDATAAQANPAGLAYLRKPEAFLEYRSVDYAAKTGVRTDTLPGGIGTFVATGTDLEDTTSVSFVSAVIPVGEKKWVLGLSRQEVLRISNSTLNRFVFSFEDSPVNTVVEGAGLIDMLVVNLNVSAGFRLNDRMAVGGSLAYSRLAVDSDLSNLVLDPGANFGSEEILEPTLDAATGIHDTDGDWALNVGIVYRVLEQNVRIGGVYRRAPRFEVEEKVVAGLDLFGTSAFGGSFPNRFHLPDSYGVSISWQPNDRLTFAQDFERIEYSDLLDGYLPGVNVLTDRDARFTVDDAFQYRAGVEYISLYRRFVAAWRGGIFTEGDPTIRAESTGTNALATPASFPRGDDQVHVTGGAGFSWKGGRFKLDVAADLAESDNEYLVSFIVRGK